MSSDPLSHHLKTILDASTAPPSTGLPAVCFIALGKDGLPLASSNSVRNEPSGTNPIDIDTVIWLASTGKPILVIAALQLVEQGKLSLDDAEQINKLIPEWHRKRLDPSGQIVDLNHDVTLRQLLVHTAGFAEPIFSPQLTAAGISTAQTLEDVLNSPAIANPGTQWAYSMGHNIVGSLVERVSGMSLGSYYHTHVFQPLGIVDMAFRLNKSMASKFSPIYFRDDKGTAVVAPFPFAIPEDDPKVPEPFSLAASGLFGTLRGFSKVLGALLNGGLSPETGNRILSPATVDLLFENEIPDMPGFAKEGLKPTVPAFAKEITHLYPQEGDPPVGWSLLGLFNIIGDPSTGRKAKTVSWAGLAGQYWWIDRESGVAGVIGSHLLPFGDKGLMNAKKLTEKAFYDALVD